MEEAERLCDRVAIMEHGRIIDIDTPDNLVRRHCSERTVVLDTDEPASGDHFRKILEVDSVTCTNMRFTIRGRGDNLVTEVIHCLSENRIQVTSFRTILPNLGRTSFHQAHPAAPFANRTDNDAARTLEH